MNRSFRKLSILAFAALSATAALHCSSNSSKPVSGEGIEGTGDIGLHLTLAPGVTVNAVSYAITGPNGFTANGSIDVSNSQTISAQIGGLPAGAGYSITLTATSTDGTVTCAGQSTFSVTAGATSTVNVHLLCHASRGDSGTIIVTGETNVCPIVTSIGASPTSVAVGSSISLTSSAFDANGAPSPLTYKWTVGTTPATDPSFSTVANPSFACTAAGSFHVVLTVSDGDAACNDSASVDLTCTGTTTTTGGTGGSGGATGGTGGATGGTGGATGGTGGTATGGTGGATGGTGGTTTDGGATGGTGGATGGTGGATGGTGGTGGTTTDGGATGGTGGATGGTGGTATGGTGGATGGTGGSTGGTGGSSGGSSVCTTGTPNATACSDCEAVQCPNDPVGSQPRCSDLATPAAQQLCQAALDCVRRTNCIALGNVNCYCGPGVDIVACKAAAATTDALLTGACKTQIAAGFATGTSPANIVGGIQDVSVPTGAAMSLAQCDYAYCGSPANNGGQECVPFCK